jgi:hypothetical protein
MTMPWNSRKLKDFMVNITQTHSRMRRTGDLVFFPQKPKITWILNLMWHDVKVVTVVFNALRSFIIINYRCSLFSIVMR